MALISAGAANAGDAPAPAAPESPAAAPAGVPAPKAGYLLRPGDGVAITVFPQAPYSCSGTLLPDGTLHLPKMDAIMAAGLTLAELQEKVGKVLADKLVGPRISATITHLAPVEASRATVLLVGGVTRSGPLGLEDGMRLYKAVELAGGAAKNADLSHVTIFHKDLTQTVVDISTPDRISNPRQNLLLVDGDSVQVPMLPTRTISLSGSVGHPGIIELDSPTRLKKALDLAGGGGREADLSRIVVYHKDLSHTLVDISTPDRVSDPTQNVLLQDGDSVEVPIVAAAAARNDLVSIRGPGVLNQGQYPFRPGMGLEDLIVAAGKFTPTADLEHVQLKRRGQLQTIDLPARLRMDINGTVALEPDDEVFVKDQSNTVILVGAVPKPGPVGMKPGQTLLQFFTECGPDVAAALDPSKADLKNVQVIRKGVPEKVDLLRALKKGRSRKDEMLTLQQGDIVFVPPHETRTGERRGLGSFLGPLAMLLPFI